MLKIKYYYASYFICLCFCLFLFNTPFNTANALKYSDTMKYSLKNRLWVHKLRIKTGIVYKLNAALGYVSVITLPVIPLDVALGNTGAFSEQIVGKQIFIKPATYDTGAASNLEIYTKYGLINILLRIRSAKLVTYNLNLANTLKDVFADNYVKSKINKLKQALFKKYNLDMNSVNEKRAKLKREKRDVMNLILLINRIKINKSASKDGITLTVVSISRIKNICYLQYQLTNNANRAFFVRNVYLYGEYGGNFFNGYNSDKLKEIRIINHTPHNVKYMPYKIIKNVIVFKRQELGAGDNMKLSFHLLIGKKLVRLKVNGFLK
ncbi:MAG: hypothetical protein ACYDDB_06780 [bacterium]